MTEIIVMHHPHSVPICAEDVLTGLQKRITIHIPTRVKGAKRNQETSTFGGVSCSNWGVAALFFAGVRRLFHMI